jgi:hypothetical protein
MRNGNFFATVAFAALAAATAPQASSAHDVWSNGQPVPSWIKAACCGVADAHLLGGNDFWLDSRGFHIKGLDTVIPFAMILPSLDGQIWAFWKDDLGPKAPVYCVFYSGGV